MFLPLLCVCASEKAGDNKIHTTDVERDEQCEWWSTQGMRGALIRPRILDKGERERERERGLFRKDVQGE